MVLMASADQHAAEARMDIEVIVEIPQGSRNKYEMDHASVACWKLFYGWLSGTMEHVCSSCTDLA